MGWSLRALLTVPLLALRLDAGTAPDRRATGYQAGSAGAAAAQGSPDAPSISLPDASAASVHLRALYHNAHTTPAMRRLIDEYFLRRGELDARTLEREGKDGVQYSRPAGFANLRVSPPAEDRRRARRPGAPLERRVADFRDSPSAPTPGAIAAGKPLAYPPEASSRPEAAPKDAREGVLLARLHLRDGRPTQALSHADAALGLEPAGADAHMLRALALERLGRREDALLAARIAARLDPGRFEGPWRRGRKGLSLLAAEEDGWRLFEPAFPRAAGIPADAGGWFLLGLILAMASGTVALRGLDWRSIVRKGRRRYGPRVSVLPASAAAAPPSARPPSKPLLAEGDVLAGKYRLARGAPHGEREAWKAVDRVLDRPALVKRIGGPGDRDKVAAAKTAATLHHPNVGDIFEILDLPQGLFVVYEHVPGKSLRAILSHAGRLPPGQIRDMLVPVCRALEHAHHRGIAHGLLTPERIWVTRQGYVKVLDFVLARELEGPGSPYAAPETRRGRPSPLSDIFSLGLCCYEMLCGGLPGGGGEPEGPLAELLERALDLDKRTRLASAGEFARLLREGTQDPATTSA